jgi:hypothetical protein
MAMAERTIFQSAFSRKKYRFGESEKKIIAMSLPNHRDVFSKTSRCLWKTIGKTFLYHHEDFFSLLATPVFRVKGKFPGERTTFHPLSRLGKGFQALGERWKQYS